MHLCADVPCMGFVRARAPGLPLQRRKAWDEAGHTAEFPPVSPGKGNFRLELYHHK